MPLTLFPSLSSGGDQHMMPMTFGTTSRIPPATPDFAGRPTWSTKTMMSRQNVSKLKCECKCFTSRDWDTDMESELSGEVVHAAGMHQTQSVSHRFGAQHALSCDWTEAAIGQGRRHDAGALTGHLDGAQLMREGKIYIWLPISFLRTDIILKDFMEFLLPGSRNPRWRSCLSPLENTKSHKNNINNTVSLFNNNLLLPFNTPGTKD